MGLLGHRVEYIFNSVRKTKPFSKMSGTTSHFHQQYMAVSTAHSLTTGVFGVWFLAIIIDSQWYLI